MRAGESARRDKGDRDSDFFFFFFCERMQTKHALFEIGHWPGGCTNGPVFFIHRQQLSRSVKPQPDEVQTHFFFFFYSYRQVAFILCYNLPFTDGNVVGYVLHKHTELEFGRFGGRV